MKRITVLASGAGSNLQALLEAQDLGGRVAQLVSDRADAGALDRAADAGVNAAVVATADYADRAGWQQGLTETVAAGEPDLVVLAGFMRILSADFVNRWPVVNVHPSLLPAFPGAKAVTAALEWGVKVTGVTVHLVDEEVDHGPILAQEAVAVAPDDTVETLHHRLQAVEHGLLPACVRALCQDRVEVQGRHTRIRP